MAIEKIKQGGPDFSSEIYLSSFIDKNIEEYTEWKIAYKVKYYNSLPVVFNDFLRYHYFQTEKLMSSVLLLKLPFRKRNGSRPMNLRFVKITNL